MTSLSAANRRRSRRSGMLKRAHIVAGDAVYDCIVLDGSAESARVQLEVPTPLPDTVQLRFVGGVTAPARRRWGNGREWGLELLEDGRQLDREQAEQAWSAYEALRDGQVERAIGLLRRDAYFSDQSLREAAEALAAARDRLEAVLRERARGPVSPAAPKPNSW